MKPDAKATDRLFHWKGVLTKSQMAIIFVTHG